MIHAGMREDAKVETRPARHSFWVLAATGLGTSIDAMAVGVGLAFLDVNIVPVAAAIGFTTLVMVTAGVMLGRVLGAVVGKRAEMIGGVILILIGTVILFEHLHGAAYADARIAPTGHAPRVAHAAASNSPKPVTAMTA